MRDGYRGKKTPMKEFEIEGYRDRRKSKKQRVTVTAIKKGEPPEVQQCCEKTKYNKN